MRVGKARAFNIMTNCLFIPGLLSDTHVWARVTRDLPGPVIVARLFDQDHITQMAHECLAAVDGQMAVAGHSMGARVALEMVRLAPARIERLALLSTGIHPLKPGETQRRAEIVSLAYEQGMAALAERWLPPMVHCPDKDVMAGLTDMVLRMTPDIHERQIRALVKRPEARAHLPSITCPTLIMVGRQDAWSPVAQHQEIASLIPHSDLDIIEGAGHFLPVEQPDAVGDRLVPFLTAPDQNNS